MNILYRTRRIFRRVRSHVLPGIPCIECERAVIGKGVVFGRGVIVKCGDLYIGDGCIIGDNVIIETSQFSIGDYGTIGRSCLFPGPGKLQIGHNFWLGRDCIVDSQGGTSIGNNVGIGSGSQLWTHMKYGSLLDGCRFHTTKPLNVSDNAWLVGHVLCSPVNIGPRSVIMFGSLVTKDIMPDTVVAGVPTQDVTSKIGRPFEPLLPQERKELLLEHINRACEADHVLKENRSKFLLVEKEPTKEDWSDKVVINFETGTYIKRNTNLERRLIRKLLPDIKLLPLNPCVGSDQARNNL